MGGRGDMALIVKVYMNETEILTVHAQRIMGQPHEMCTYKTDTGDIIDHHYDDGACRLAARLLLAHKEKP